MILSPNNGVTILPVPLKLEALILENLKKTQKTSEINGG